ncbi:MAG: paraquat-inducible protein A [Caulobacterales bacterium]|nr:paraquat-inducible protein A [Caulobacterales bacterium]
MELSVEELNRRYVACRSCDALCSRPELEEGRRAACPRCGETILERKSESADRTTAALLAALILYAVAVSFPFLSMERAGLESRMSVVDAVGALWLNDFRLLALAAGLLILVFPLARFLLLLGVVGAVRLGRDPGPISARAFRAAQDLEPWAMAEIFMIGVIVSLVKVGKMATLSIGPAFWALAALVVVASYAATVHCRDTIWAMMRARL